MSKKLEKRATRLVRKAEDRALAIRRVVREYHDAIQASAIGDPARQTERHREIERAVVKYNEVHKALKRLRKRIHRARRCRNRLKPGYEVTQGSRLLHLKFNRPH